MKKIAGLFLVFAFVLAAPVLKLHAQKSFEGTLTWTISMPMMDSDKHNMIINVKGRKTEMDIDMGDQGGMMKAYTDPSKKKRYVVVGGSKMGMVSDIDNSVKYNVKADSLSINPTGQKATIAGHPAEEYISNGTNGNVSLWVTADLPEDVRESFYNALSNSPGMDPKSIKQMKYLNDRGLVPVRIVVRIAGQEMMTVDFVNYERKKLDKSLFVPPADIKYSPMPTGADGGAN
jgi:mRNA-degrading endonuclease HigB of HigAB toxin-antitoxin module